MKYGTRNLIELSFSGVFSIQVLVHLRTSDVAWFNNDFDKHNSQLLSIISKEILPSACREEVEAYYERRGRIIGSDTGGKEAKTKRRSKETVTSKDKTASKSISSKHFTKKKIKETRIEKKSEVRSYVASMDTKWYFNDSIQIACQIKPIRTSHRATLIFNNYKESQVENSKQSLSTFQSFKPIPKIISIWCYPFVANDPKNPSFSGFPRTEFIPLSTVFKES